MLQDIKNVGKGAAGVQNQLPGSVHAALTELGGFTISLLAGGLADAKLDLAAIRSEDTIISAINNATGGVLTDITGTMSISETRAQGTITLSDVVAGETVTVQGVTYTAVAGVAANYNEFSIDGATDADDATALAAAINAYEKNHSYLVIAEANSAVVTITAVVDGTAGNAYTLAETGSGMTVSGATLSGGTATGGVSSSGATDQVILFWFDKK